MSGPAIPMTRLDPALFTPFDLAGHRLQSRFVMPAMQRMMCVDGAPIPALTAYYRQRGEGGVGIVISESCAVDHPSAYGSSLPYARLNAATFAAWRDCIGTVTATGAAMLVQLWHEGGRRQDADGLTLSPSGLAAPDMPGGRAASEAEIGEIADAFLRSAKLAQDAGATGVEIHAAHGFLLDQFLWAATNLRQDRFGGPDIAARSRLLADIVSRIRAACGPGFLISVRFSQWKERDYRARIAADPAELGLFTRMLRGAGANVLHCSTRRFWEPEWPDSEASLAGWARRLGGLPTIAVGSFALDRDIVESFRQEGEATFDVETSIAALNRRYAAGDFDLVAIGRGLIADAMLVRKLERGAHDEITPFRRALLGAL